MNTDPRFYTSARLAALPKIRHGFFTRRGGISTGIFASLNCGGRGTAEPAEIVDENRLRVARTLGLDGPALVSTVQVHGAAVAVVREPWPPDARPEADAMVTRTVGIGLGILTADCVPVLLADARAGVVGAAHAGWKGARGGVLPATIAAMEALGARHDGLIAAVGPAIAQPSYEVDAAFRERFVARCDADASYFTALDAGGRCRFDLPAYICTQLTALGVAVVDRLAHDTYAEENDFFSYRRSVHRGESDYGRQISVIALTAL